GGLLDKDNDGVPDFDDACPLQSGPMHYGGCPISGNDQDLDGINDTADKCPDLPGPPRNKGCPQDYFRYNQSANENDNDRDGVPSKFDLCPNTPGPFENDGCPVGVGDDTDGDGVIDIYDMCPTVNGTIFSDGCPPRGFRDTPSTWFDSFSMADKDTDGVPDGVDRCPDTWGLPFMDGCPFGQDTNGKAFSGFDNDGDGVNDTTDNCPGFANPAQTDSDSDGKGDSCDFLDIELPRLGVVFEPGVHIQWGPRIFFPENSSINFNGNITNMTNTTFNVFNMTLPPLGKLIDFEMNYSLAQDEWENFSAHSLGLDDTGLLIPTPGKNATAVLPKNGFYVNFTKIHGSINFSKLVVDANNTNVTTDSSNMSTVNLSISGVLLDIHFNEPSTSAPLQVASTGLNPEYGLYPDPQNFTGAGDAPYLQLNCSTEFTNILDNTTLKIPIPSGYIDSSMKINYFNSSTGNWTELETDTTTVPGYAIANTSHCSVYGIAGSVYGGGGTVSTSGGGGGGGGSPSPVTLVSAGATEMTSTTYSNILISLSAGGKLDKDRFVEVPNTLAGPLLLNKNYPLPTDPTAAQFARTVTTITGDVFALAAEVSEDRRFQYIEHENKLVIARGDLGVDSMAAVAYAKAKNIPILLVKPNELPSVTEEAILKMMAVRKREIIIVGGPVAVSNDVEGLLADMGDVKRIWGETRVETSLALAKETYTDKNKVRVIVITDYANPKIDAVLMSYVMDAPLLYVKSDSLHPEVKDYISQHKETIFGPTKVMLMGVDPKVASEINAALG
ncbi:MAG: cell wall-binding repeat-containing protein, partial [Candidatus Hydrothermarchaeales archaeon]